MSALDLKLTPKQSQLIYDLADVDEVFWGGQAGGGKSEGLLMFALKRRIENPGSAGLMLRRTLPELEKSLIRKSRLYFGHFAKYSEQKKLWKFKPEYGGGIQEFGFCESDKDLYQYMSAEYDDIEIDEASHFTEYQAIYLTSRLRPRSCKKGLLRLASNPGNRGHQWLKARYVDVARNKIHTAFDEDEGTFKTRFFLPATLEDNTLMSKKERQNYRSWLNTLPEHDRRMLRDGDWDYFHGAAFPELSKRTHSFEPKPVPSNAKILMSFDFGFGKPFSIGWWWTDYDGRMWRFAEWYGWNGKADQGLRLAPRMIAQGIIKREKVLGIHARVYTRPADPSVFGKTPNMRGGGQGPSVAEMMAEEDIILTPSDNDRLMGKQQCHERFRIPLDEKGLPTDELPMVMISTDCDHFWRTVPTIPLDENNIEDVDDKNTEDHVYDEARYAFMSRPINPLRPKPEKSYVEKIFDQIHDSDSSVEELSEIHEI